jgi:hypothetical protein
VASFWIKIEHVTPDKPEVHRIAEILGIDPDAVLGKLIRVWVWCDQQTRDGNAPSVTRALLDRLTNVTGFASAMMSAGWLQESDGGLIFPNFGAHNGQTAKARALTKNRVDRCRDKSNGGSVTTALQQRNGSVTREEKRRDIDEESPSETCSEPPKPAASEPPILTVPCVGKGPKEYHLTASKLAEYETAFPALDVLAELRAASQWCRDNPPKRKTARGMPAFFTRWLTRCQDLGRNHHQPQPQKQFKTAGERQAEYARETLIDALCPGG